MNIPVEVTITIKGDESTYRQKFLCYEQITLSHEDLTIKDCINQAREAYKGDIESVKVRTAMEWQ